MADGSYDSRARNYYGHEAQDLRAREEMMRRGVPADAPNLPSADYTHQGMARVVQPRGGIQQGLENMRQVAAQPAPVDEEMELLARQNGFANAEQMRAWVQQRQRQQGGTVPAQGEPAPASVGNAMAAHPASILGYVSDRVSGALNR